MTHFRGGIDELKGDLFGGGSLDLRHQGLSEHEDSLLGSNNATLNHHEIVSDHTIVGETTQRSDVLFGQVSVGGGVVLDTGGSSSSDSVDLLVHFGSVVVTQLTGSGDAESNSGRVPRSDATHFSVTSVGFLLEVLNAPTFNNTLETFTLGDTDDIDHFVLSENGVNFNFLFEVVVGEVNLLGDRSTVNLNFEHVVLLLAELGESLHLGRANSADHGTVFLNSVQIHFKGFFLVVVLLGVLGEGFLLGVHPVLVKSTESIAVKFLGPNSGKSTESTGGIDVTDETNNGHGGSFDNSHGFDDFLLMELGTNAVDFTHDVGHTSLETSEGSEVASLLGIILGERSNATSVVSGSTSGGKTEVTMSGGFEFTVRH